VMLFCFFSYPFKYPLSYVAVALPYLLMLGKPARVLLKQHRRTASLIMIVAGIAALTATLVEYSYERRWSRLIRISEAGGSKAVVDEFDELYDHYSCNPYFLYSDMVVQYKSGRCHKAMKLYDRLCEYQSGYNMELLAGDALAHLEEYDDALLHYRRAGCMCPVRFAPLCGMLEVYEQTNDTARADSVAHVILAKKVKIPSYVVDEIQNEAKMWLKRR
jgi:tetratricopeptide (TPR) repeat protein